METFIDQVISDIRKNHGDDFREVCIIFPTRRACMIFRNKLAEVIGKPVWAPGVMGISDFVSKHIQSRIADETELLFLLFEVYKKIWPGQDFKKYFAWGKMLLNDFDDIDKHLLDPDKIFINIRELKRLEATFLPEAESFEWIQEFTGTFDEGELSLLQKEFNYNWDQLKTIYTSFNQNLDKAKLSYEGKAYREIIKNLRTGNFKSQWSKFYFVGFYGLSRSEEELIRLIEEKLNATIYWDADAYYISNPKHEAGYYFRKTKLFKGELKPSRILSESKSLEISGIPLQAGQSKYAGELIRERLKKGDINLDKTVVILPDENMLFPLLYSLPPETGPVNVTMGYPLSHSPFVDLLRLLAELQKFSKINKSGGIEFYRKIVERIIYHPLIGLTRGKETTEELFQTYLSAEDILKEYQDTDVVQFFRAIPSTELLLNYLEDVFTILHKILNIPNEKYRHFEDQVISFVWKEISSLLLLMKDHQAEVDVDTAWNMILENVENLKVPFSGEAVKGLQVMGFLETRALDFENLIILSVNEGVLPMSSSNKSFIPYSLRKGFGLPTFEDQDASYSYHFYRLLHRSKNINLVYNTEVRNSSGGEKSRYLLQIEHELQPIMWERLKTTMNIVNTPVHLEPIAEIAIKKDTSIQLLLEQFTTSSTGKSRSFSSSALTTYINCSLQFYFRYIAGLKEKDEQSESIAADVFGNILHHSLELLYQDYVDKEVHQSDFEKINGNISRVIESATLEIFRMLPENLEGNDILMIEVIRELVKRILQNDQKEVPFKIENLEKNYATTIDANGKTLNLYGNFDRVDVKNGIHRIIDYKTGKVELKETDMENWFSNPKSKELFQLHFYSLLYRDNHPEAQILPGFYVARKLGGGIIYPNSGKVITNDILDRFADLLRILLTEIIDPAVTFHQTQDIQRCKYCPYKNNLQPITFNCFCHLLPPELIQVWKPLRTG